VALSCASPMQHLIPVIDDSDGQHSSLIQVFLKTEKICISVSQNSREKDWPGWGRRLVMAWMALGFVARIVI
jgi:hypothetical protein